MKKRRDELHGRVLRAFKKHYAVTKDEAEAHNAALNEVAGPYDPEAPESTHEHRRRISDILRHVSERVASASGDPYYAAVKEAMSALRADRVADKVRAEAKAQQREAKHEARKAGMSLDEYTDMGGGDWYLYVLFDDAGNYQGWAMDHAQYFRGHDGPMAAVSIHPSVTYKDIESEVRETLSQAVEWDQ